MLLEILLRWLLPPVTTTPDDLTRWLAVSNLAGAVSTFALLATMIVLWRRREQRSRAQAAALQRHESELRIMRAEIEQLKLEAQRAHRERVRLNRKLGTIEEVLQVVLQEVKDLKAGDNMRAIFRQEAALLLHVPGAAQHVTVASGERSAAVGRDVRRSPVVTGDDNEMDT